MASARYRGVPVHTLRVTRRDWALAARLGAAMRPPMRPSTMLSWLLEEALDREVEYARQAGVKLDFNYTNDSGPYQVPGGIPWRAGPLPGTGDTVTPPLPLQEPDIPMPEVEGNGHHVLGTRANESVPGWHPSFSRKPGHVLPPRKD